MPIDIIVPPLSQTSDTLVLTAWLKKVGEAVTKGEALFEVETDKATLEVEAPVTGILSEVLAEPGTEVAVKARIGRIEVEAEQMAREAMSPVAALDVTDPHPPAPSPVDGAMNLRLSGQQEKGSHNADRAERILASPRARGLAEKEGVALAALTATGPRGLIVERDVRAYLEAHAAAPEPETAALPPPQTERRRVPLSPTRRTIARRLQANQQETVPVTLTREVDATEFVALRERLVADPMMHATRPTYTDLLISITARCLVRHPALNATFDGEALTYYDAVHLGLAVDTERGLLVPVLRDAARQGLVALAQARATAVERARAGTLTPGEMVGGTFSLTNLGALGIDAFTPLLNPPQIAILGVGRIRAVAEQRQSLWLALTFDHRAVDGAPAARLLAEMAELVERPDRVWL